MRSQSSYAAISPKMAVFVHLDLAVVGWFWDTHSIQDATKLSWGQTEL
jgi:hypothetical protein